MEFVDLNSS
jgi:hypothetical protein